jgi:hypothetical protein
VVHVHAFIFCLLSGSHVSLFVYCSHAIFSLSIYLSQDHISTFYYCPSAMSLFSISWPGIMIPSCEPCFSFHFFVVGSRFPLRFIVPELRFLILCVALRLCFPVCFVVSSVGLESSIPSFLDDLSIDEPKDVSSFRPVLRLGFAKLPIWGHDSWLG